MWLAGVLTGRATRPRPHYPRTVSMAFEGPASTRLGQFFGPAVDQHPGLSGFSLLDHGREAFTVRLALADLAERSLDMQYYVWDGDTTGRIIVDRVMKAADRGVRVRLLIDDPYYKANGSVIAALDAHPNVEIRLFNPLANRSWSTLEKAEAGGTRGRECRITNHPINAATGDAESAYLYSSGNHVVDASFRLQSADRSVDELQGVIR
jgi:putative cardiolipin synthase